MRWTRAGLAALAVAGCQDARAVDPDPCGATRAYEVRGAAGMRQGDGLIGLPVGDVAFPEGRNLRVLGPGDAATMDFVRARLNVRTDAEGRVVALSCG